MKKVSFIISILFLMLTSTGCVRRVVTIDSQPQGAEIYFDRRLIGQTPCSYEFLYYGGHHLEITKEGYANLRTVLKLKGPFYQYFPFSFISELLIPWQITDEHNFSFTLEKGRAKRAIISPIEKPQPSLPATKLERIQKNQ